MERQEVEKLINAEVERFRFVGIRKDRFKAIMRHLLCGDTLEINQSKVTTIFGKPVEKVDLGKWPFFDIDWSDYFRGIDKIDTVDIATLTAATNVYIGLFRGFRDISMPLGELCAILNKECGEDYWHCDESEKDLTIAQMWCNITSDNNAINRASTLGFNEATLICANGLIQAVKLHYMDFFNEGRKSKATSRKSKPRTLDIPRVYLNRINKDERIKAYIIPNGTVITSDVVAQIYGIIKSNIVYPYGKKAPRYMHTTDKSSFIEMYIRTLTPLVDFLMELKEKYPPTFYNWSKTKIINTIIDVTGLSEIKDVDGKSFFTFRRIWDYLKSRRGWSFDLDIWKDTVK